jgi:hypothetical protein
MRKTNITITTTTEIGRVDPLSSLPSDPTGFSVEGKVFLAEGEVFFAVENFVEGKVFLAEGKVFLAEGEVFFTVENPFVRVCG